MFSSLDICICNYIIFLLTYFVSLIISSFDKNVVLFHSKFQVRLTLEKEEMMYLPSIEINMDCINNQNKLKLLISFNDFFKCSE